MSGKPATVDPATPLYKAAEIFWSRKIGSTPVIAAAESGIQGIFTQSDVLRALLAVARLVYKASRAA